MPLAVKRATVGGLLLLVSISAVSGADKDSGSFRPRPLSDYPHKQTSEMVTIAAEEFESDEQARPAFGKKNPYQYGILPVLVLVQNNTGKALRLDRMRVIYVMPDNTRIESTPAAELRSLHGARQPKVINSPLPGIGSIGSRSKQPLSQWEIEGRAFSARVLPPGEIASGFFYFQSGRKPGATLYVSGLAEAAGRELLFFEIPLSSN
jgi:hypothetical protein